MSDHNVALEADRFWQSFLDDPFSVRGLHQVDGVWTVEAYLPGATAVDLVSDFDPPVRMKTSGDGRFSAMPRSVPAYRLRIQWGETVQETEDPYSFGPVLGAADKYLFSEGSHWQLADRFGAVPMRHEGIVGVSFAVWAPNARRVSVIGDFNSWDGRRHPMRLLHGAGIWEIFIPRLLPGERYKYEIVDANGVTLPAKADPVARAAEMPPATASVIAPVPDYPWHDDDWRSQRRDSQSAEAPISIYELHAASWMRPEGTESGTLTWAGLAQRLIPYVKQLGFTHIELMPIMEHPFSGSWGYQPLSQFAPSARFGSPADFAKFVDDCHLQGLGVILDWVPAHFPNDTHGLARFDGSPLYEHADPREGFHPDWNTCVYNLGRREVQGWLIASALWWCETFHIDGLRVDAVASMLYRDYSRKQGQWIPNRYGGRENLEAIEFLKRLNETIKERCPGVITIAEESTAWPGVSAPVVSGGLGFNFKWNMGWMHDTLSYIERDPVHRRWHHNDLTFGLLYAFSERFVLPLSHDEVVHGKGSLYGRVPGDPWRKLATLRAYFTFMWTHPGKKLLFMGGELAAPTEWNHDTSLDWRLLGDPGHKGVHDLIGELNRLYRAEPDLHVGDAQAGGFRWIVGDDADNSVFAYCRGDGPIITIVNMTPTPRHGYQIGVPHAGRWKEILNSDSAHFAGSNVGNLGLLETISEARHGFEQSLRLTLPPLGAILLKLDTSNA
jgi:1,4-alpha-glucan branching enzyme